MTYGLDALVPLIMIGLPLWVISIICDRRKKTPVERTLRGATKL